MRAVAALAVLALGCSKVSSGPPESAAPLPGEAAANKSPDPVELALCGGRPDCRLESELWQADTRTGSRRVVAVVRQSPGPHRAGPDPFQLGLSPAPTEEAASCAAWETSLTSVGSDQAARVQLLASDCPSGDRPPLLVDLGGGKMRYSVGADGGVPSHEYELELDPPRLEREIHRGRGGVLAWDHETYRGEICQEQECSPLMLEAPVDGAFSREGWKTTGLGECAMLLDGARTPGELSHGELRAADVKSAVRMLVSGDTLYVEVTDDVFVTSGARVDALSFYSMSPQAMPGTHGLTARLRMDGQLTDWKGNTRPVPMATGTSTRRFAVTDLWPGPEGLWKVSYEDTDDGRTLGPGQSTGKLSKEPWVFVSPFPCASQGGALHVDRRRVRGADEPILP